MLLKVKYLFPNIPELVSRAGDSGYDIRAAIGNNENNRTTAFSSEVCRWR